MSNSIVRPVRAAIAHLGVLMERGGVDANAAVVRMFLALIVLIYLLTRHHIDQYLPDDQQFIVKLSVIYFGYAFVQWMSNILWPGPSVIRRSISVLADAGIVTIALIIAGETSAPFFGGYLWVTIANGLRYGRKYLFATNAVCVLGFVIVLLVTPYWQQQQVLGVGLLFWLILLPGYVAALLKKLEDALHRANLANKTKSDFLANMSHELRTPLNAILGYSEMLHEDAVEQDSRQAADDLEKIQRSATHLLGLINGILDLSKIESGKLNLVYESFDIRMFFEDLLSGMQPLFEKHRNYCRLELHMSQYQVNTDKLKLKQVLLNLLGNANKFTETGEIHIVVNQVEQAGRSSLQMEIRDTGIGIAEDKLGSIFDPCMQADTSTTRRYEGTGLGLAITLRFIEMLGGSIRVESAEGKGSTFFVTIPNQQVSSPSLLEKVCEAGISHKLAS